jgi:hypothetical protein
MAERWQRHIVGAESVRPWFESDLKSRQHTDLAERQGGECRQQRNVAPRLEATEVIGPSGPAGGVHWSVSAQGFWHMGRVMKVNSSPVISSPPNGRTEPRPNNSCRASRGRCI